MYTIQKTEKTIEVNKYVEEYVNVPEFQECCKTCPNYEKVWSCPPYDFDPVEYWKRFSRFTVVAYKVIFKEGISVEESYQILKEIKQHMSYELFQREKRISGAVSLSAGSCLLCVEEGCTRKEGKPCRYPHLMRYSVESIGGDVGRTVSRLMGIELQWIEEGKVPPYFVLVGGLLEK